MQKVRLTIKGLSHSERQTGAYALLLAEENGLRKLPIVIGGFEAQSIAIALEKAVSPPRPLTHDLFKNVLDAFGVTVTEVIIHKIKDGVFFASIVAQGGGTSKQIDARPSDAVALAVRYNCPIFTTSEVLDKAGMILEDEGKPTPITGDVDPDAEDDDKLAEASETPNPIHLANLKELDQMMKRAVANEDYELAARIRDEIDKRQKK
jgi:bifunctional DNase/RNase